MDLALLLLRLVVGLTFVAHGTQKLFGWFGGYGLAGTGGFLEQLGFHPGRRAAWMAGLGEAGGGLLLALGALTPLAAAILIGVMLVAIVSVHLEKGFFNPNGGYEYPLVLSVSALVFSLAGPGRYSVDAALGHEYAGVAWALGSLLVGLVAASLELAARHRPTVTPAESKTA
ncbi:MAG TPA: DoxX family protein [Candidatus Eisenbacteria bacterium]|nr:DoxX family protein [Candidatus Eisenbacteria bacterium]